MNNVVATVIKFVVKGQQAAVSAINGVRNASATATRTMATLATSLGTMGGALGHAASQAANFMASIQQMGAIGGIVAGAQLAITATCNHFIEKANAMLEAAENLSEKVRTRLDRMNQARMDGVVAALDEATTKAREAAAEFDALASSYMKVQAAQNATAKSGSDAAASAMAAERSKAMAGAGSDGERARIGAEWDVRIARAKGEAARGEQDRNLAAANDEADARAKQAKDAAKTEKKAQRAMERAARVYEEDVNADNTRNLAASKAAKEAAEKAYAEAVNDRRRKDAEAVAATERVKQAENARAAAISEATRAVTDAEDAERRLVAAQTEAARAELERLRAEKAAEKAAGGGGAGGAAPADRTGALTAAKGDFGEQFRQAFDLWRDPEAAAAAVSADKQRSADMKRFNREVNRYGGKYKIDEYAALMRAGDEEGMQAKLDEWRKSSRFTPQAEQLVKAEAARQNENAAERALEKIERNTADLAKTFEKIMQVK